VEIARAEETFVVNYWRQKEAEWKETMKRHRVNFISFSAKDKKELAGAIMKLKDRLAEKVPPEESQALFAIYDRFAK